MKYRAAILVLTMVAGISTVSAKKDQPKEYLDGKVVEIAFETNVGGVFSSGDSGDRRATYVIESKEGRYEVRDFQSARIVKPMDVSSGAAVTYRLHPKGRILYVATDKHERPLEVMRFTPAKE